MKWFTGLLDFYVRSSLHVAINLVSLFLVFNFWNVRKLELPMIILLFTFTVAGYNWIKYGELFLKGKAFPF